MGAIGTRRWFAAALLVALVARRIGRRSGASRTEARGTLSGDDLVAEPMWVSTRAITIDAPPAEVWPWLVQMGFPSYWAGWYTPHWLDRWQWGIEERSADHVRPELQQIEVGDRIPDSRDWSAYFTVARVDPERALVLRSSRHLLRPMREIDFSWAFVLQPLPGDRSRLLMRARAWCRPRFAWLVLGWLIGLGDYVNASAMLRGIKCRSEAARRTRRINIEP